jgi:hypothetical protein
MMVMAVAMLGEKGGGSMVSEGDVEHVGKGKVLY